MDLGDLDRYGWVRELVDDRPAVRARALARHRELLSRTRYHGRFGERTGTLLDPVSAFTCLAPGWSSEQAPHDPEDCARLAPFGVLFLQWAERFPHEWRTVGWALSPWSWKDGVLGALGRHEPTPLTAPALEDLLIAAVRRPQRCEDSGFCSLARRIDTPGLRDRLAEAAEESETARLRAGYVLWLMDHPDEQVGRSAAWLRWRRSRGCPVTAPAAAAELEEMKPAAAAALLERLPAQDLARVLEGLRAGPAASIAGCLDAGQHAVPAIDLMDVLMAARMLRSMVPDAVARLLAAMDPGAAAARLSGPNLTQLLTLMDAPAARAVLQAMTPATAGKRLSGLLPADAAALLQLMDPDFTVAARVEARFHMRSVQAPDAAG